MSLRRTVPNGTWCLNSRYRSGACERTQVAWQVCVQSLSLSTALRTGKKILLRIQQNPEPASLSSSSVAHSCGTRVTGCNVAGICRGEAEGQRIRYLESGGRNSWRTQAVSPPAQGVCALGSLPQRGMETGKGKTWQQGSCWQSKVPTYLSKRGVHVASEVVTVP